MQTYIDDLLWLAGLFPSIAQSCKLRMHLAHRIKRGIEFFLILSHVCFLKEQDKILSHGMANLVGTRIAHPNKINAFIFYSVELLLCFLYFTCILSNGDFFYKGIIVLSDLLSCPPPNMKYNTLIISCSFILSRSPF